MNDQSAQAAANAGLFPTWDGRVEAAWIDINGHMNVSRYDRVFDAAERRLMATLGVDDASIARTGRTLFRLERFLRYERELLAGAAIHVLSRVIWSDGRRIHHFHELRSAGGRAAFADALSIHVDLSVRRAAPIPQGPLLARVEAARDAQASLALPPGVLRRIDGRLAP